MVQVSVRSISTEFKDGVVAAATITVIKGADDSNMGKAYEYWLQPHAMDEKFGPLYEHGAVVYQGPVNEPNLEWDEYTGAPLLIKSHNVIPGSSSTPAALRLSYSLLHPDTGERFVGRGCDAQADCRPTFASMVATQSLTAAQVAAATTTSGGGIVVSHSLSSHTGGKQYHLVMLEVDASDIGMLVVNTCDSAVTAAGGTTTTSAHIATAIGLWPDYAPPWDVVLYGGDPSTGSSAQGDDPVNADVTCGSGGRLVEMVRWHHAYLPTMLLLC